MAFVAILQNPADHSALLEGVASFRVAISTKE